MVKIKILKELIPLLRAIQLLFLVIIKILEIKIKIIVLNQTWYKI